MFCPECRSEYVEGITACVDCQVPLVQELPPEPEVEYRDFMPVKTYFSRHEAELARSVLEANGIEATIASDDAGGLQPGLSFTRGVQVLVNGDDILEAEEVLKDLENAPAPPIPEEEVGAEDASEEV